MIVGLCGMLLGAWYREKASLQHVIMSTISAALLIALFIPRTLTLMAAPPICCTLLVGALTLAPRCQPLERIGHISYSWYLLHFIFGIPIVLNLGKIIPDWSASLIAGIVTLTPSIVTYAVIERPLISFGKGLISLGRDSIPA
jgi:peptidoglycan/LPS O-acetylase OafA/YrhL